MTFDLRTGLDALSSRPDLDDEWMVFNSSDGKVLQSNPGRIVSSDGDRDYTFTRDLGLLSRYDARGDLAWTTSSTRFLDGGEDAAGTYSAKVSAGYLLLIGEHGLLLLLP